jgi:hypothetical protein
MLLRATDNDPSIPGTISDPAAVRGICRQSTASKAFSVSAAGASASSSAAAADHKGNAPFRTSLFVRLFLMALVGW